MSGTYATLYIPVILWLTRIINYVGLCLFCDNVFSTISFRHRYR